MPKHFQQPKANYKNVHEFQHAAIHTLTHLYGHGRKFTDFDFGEKDVEVENRGKETVKERFYFCIGYQTGERVPAEASPGAALTPAQKEHETKLAAEQEAKDAAGGGLVNATDFAVELAVKKGVNLLDIAKLLPPGTKIGKKQVEDYLKSNPQTAPEKDKANEPTPDAKTK